MNQLTSFHVKDKTKKIRFFFVPKTYFIRDDTYYIVIELKVFYKGHHTQKFFVAENMLVEFKLDKGYQNFNDNK